jgi:tetratricopeptide (TPR) repeat protein
MARTIAFPGLALGASAIGASFALAAPLVAQDGARAVVQPLPPPEARQLSEALQRLAVNPRDLDALIAAGNASLKLDDIDAALGFFTRAEEIAPTDPRTKAGRAAAMIQEENPFEALRLFDEAERAGASLADLATERALAYDLVGDNAQAQRLYREVLARGEDAETSRRLAVSLAISGDDAGMERVLLPMLQRRDLAAYRARAFSLAILGKVDDALSISDAVMPKSMAARIAPYLRYMPRLTRAQQAAAANLGNFPRTADIGRDDARIAQYASAGPSPVAPPVQTADARLVPTGEPLGPSLDADGGRRRPDREDAEQVALAAAPPPEPAAQIAQAQAEPAPVQSALAEVAVADPLVIEPAPQPVVTEIALAELPGPELSLGAPEQAAAPVPEPSFDLAQIAGSIEASPQDFSTTTEVALADTTPAVLEPEPSAPEAGLAVVDTQLAVLEPTPTEFIASAPVIVDTVEAVAIAPPAAAPPMQVLNGPAGSTATQTTTPANVAAAFADFDFALSSGAPAAGAVDLTRITVPRERLESKPTVAKQPARHWVQLATARDRTRLGFDFRRIVGESKGLLGSSKGYLAKWGETNRLLTGPFTSEAAARAFVTKLDDAGIKSFTFSSEEGEEVTAIAAR